MHHMQKDSWPLQMCSSVCMLQEVAKQYGLITCLPFSKPHHLHLLHTLLAMVSHNSLPKDYLSGNALSQDQLIAKVCWFITASRNNMP